MKSPYQRREEATKRNQAYAKLSTEEKIANCGSRRGKSQRELRKLVAQIIKNG